MSKLEKQLKREQLLEQGVSLLMEQGYHGTGLKKILDTVQIPKGSFYHYFESKEAFGAEVVTHYIEPFIVQLAGHLNNPELDGLSALNTYFSELITAVGQGDFKGGCLLGNLMGEIGDTSDICRASLKQAVKRYRDLLAVGLAKAQREGTVRTDKTPERMADLLANTWQGALLRMKIEQSVAPIQDCCDDLLGDYFKA
ncbi:MAG: TetR family transcriptional regulator C-terminal domain-containing protein [Methylococcales bacterium]